MPRTTTAECSTQYGCAYDATRCDCTAVLVVERPVQLRSSDPCLAARSTLFMGTRSQAENVTPSMPSRAYMYQSPEQLAPMQRAAAGPPSRVLWYLSDSSLCRPSRAHRAAEATTSAVQTPHVRPSRSCHRSGRSAVQWCTRSHSSLHCETHLKYLTPSNTPLASPSE